MDTALNLSTTGIIDLDIVNQGLFCKIDAFWQSALGEYGCMGDTRCCD